jgi:hypothetical protein
MKKKFNFTPDSLGFIVAEPGLFFRRIYNEKFILDVNLEASTMDTYMKKIDEVYRGIHPHSVTDSNVQRSIK